MDGEPLGGLPGWGRRVGAAALTLIVLAGWADVRDVVAQAREAWCPEPEVAQFDFWLGEWDVQNRNRPPAGERWYETGTATNRVYTVVGGCAVVEHWRGHAFPGAGLIQGFSLRAWDPAAGRWELVLLWPTDGSPRFGNPAGVFEDGRADFHNRFTTPAGDTVLTRLSFHDMEEDAFTWSDGLSRDGGRTWESSWRMRQRRRAPAAPGLWNGPTVGVDRCPGEEHREGDRWLGEWAGTRRTAAGDTTSVRARLVRILGGCAVMERSWAGDGSWSSFRVRAWEPGTGAWVEYGLASDRREILRREAATEGGAVVVTDVERPAGSAFRRTRWLPDGDGLRRVEEAAPAPDGPWTAVWTDRMPNRVNGG